MTQNAAAFAGSIPPKYDQYLGPMFFEPYAIDLVSRLALEPGDAVLEMAAGTGIVTAQLVAALPRGASLTATDLNEAMLAIAQKRIDPAEPVTWKTADASALPFGDDWFDAVVCQFGVMFFPDKPAALREALRVLHPGGLLVFNVWDSLAANPIARIAHETIASFYPHDPPTFYTVPFGMFDVDATKQLLADAGFEQIASESKTLDGRSPSAHEAATGLVAGAPVFQTIQDRGGPLEEIVAAVTDRLASEGGAAPMQLPMRAHIFTARRP